MIDIEKLAGLARIKLTPSEEKKLRKEFGEILDYVSKLKEIDTRSGRGKEFETALDLENAAREDDNPNEPGGFSEDLLKEAPSVSKSHIKVKHILE